MDLKQYAERVGYSGACEATAEVLRALHLAHATHIPFENLDVLLGRPIRLDEEGLSEKLVAGGRGGYCFEQNSLFAAVLEAIGFKLRRLAARVLLGTKGTRPRLHMLLLVEAGGRRWIADVGFGADGLLYPIAFEPGAITEQFAWKHRVMADGENYVLETLRPEGWIPLYAFGLEEHFPIDFEVANYYTSTHPRSIFRKMLRVQRPEPDRRLLLLNRKLIEQTAEGETETPVPDDDALLEVLNQRFGLVFPPGTRFPIEES